MTSSESSSSYYRDREKKPCDVSQGMQKDAVLLLCTSIRWSGMVICYELLLAEISSVLRLVMFVASCCALGDQRQEKNAMKATRTAHVGTV